MVRVPLGYSNCQSHRLAVTWISSASAGAHRGLHVSVEAPEEDHHHQQQRDNRPDDLQLEVVRDVRGDLARAAAPVAQNEVGQQARHQQEEEGAHEEDEQVQIVHLRARSRCPATGNRIERSQFIRIRSQPLARGSDRSRRHRRHRNSPASARPARRRPS